MIPPDAITAAVDTAWSGTVGPDGVFTSATVPVPPTAAGTDAFAQGIPLAPATFVGREISVWTTHLRP
ncbi:MAG: hypothetical protein AAF682_29230 [Planctomycetota bacterium]